jgi:hypothetical protein
MFTDGDAKLSVAMPLLNPRVPERVPTKLLVPTFGIVWKMFSVKVPVIGGPGSPDGDNDVARISPKLAPPGVNRELRVPLKVNVVRPPNVAVAVPLALNTPVVENVTGSAFANCAAPANTTARRTVISELLRRVFILLLLPSTC